MSVALAEAQGFSRLRRRRPPAPVPRSEPLSRLGLVLALNRNPLTIWTRRHFEEPILQGEGLVGFGTIISDPASIRHVLVENADNYRKDALQRRVLAPGLGDGLLTAEGESWRIARRTLAPLFTPRQTAAFADRMLQAVNRRLDRIARRRPGSVLRVDQQMAGLTFDVLAETLFSNSIASGASAFGQAITLYFDTLGRLHPFDLLDLPSWLPRVGRGRVKPALDFFSAQVEAIVSARRTLMQHSPREAPRDLLQLLLEASDPETGQGLSEIEVAANIITFIGAGHETTANTLTWALYLVQTEPAVRERLEAEADVAFAGAANARELLDRLPFARAVIEEALRLYPPVPSLSREAIKDDKVAGRVIPQGSLVVIAPWVLHRHRKLWAAPDLFQPDRFLPNYREAIDRFQFLPFGAGPRVCIGQGFAMQEAVLALAAIVQRFRFILAEGHQVFPVHRVTLRPAGGLPMTLTFRAGA